MLTGKENVSFLQSNGCPGSLCECQALGGHHRLLWRINGFYELCFLTLQETDTGLFNFDLAKKSHPGKQ